LGVLLSKVPLDPRCAKILIVASKYDLLHYAIMIVACLSVLEIYDDESLYNHIVQEGNYVVDAPKKDEQVDDVSS